jgi:sugar phosphate isomerase/epimerase
MELTPEKMVSTFAERGWKHSELSSEHGNVLLARGNAEREGSALKAHAEEQGFSFPQAHFDLGADISQPAGSVERQATLDNFRRWCDLFAALDVRCGVLHPGGERLWKEGWSRPDTLKLSAEVLHELLSYVEDSPTTLCLENSWHHEDAMQLIDSIDSPKLCTCMDTGHLNLTGGHWSDYIKWAGSRLKALHIADNLGVTDNHILPYGAGTIQWQGFAKALRDVDYDGLFNFEVGGESKDYPLDIKLTKLDYVAKLAETMLNQED